ncbi:MAG: hypothetical protein K9J16_14730 [Melioribacteraceae bacterium]|nr:hypothetical protein [Melioribacteraceae bacterium]MCF8355821.1 hypothetical protein [Melioribacteraceae bacterium]MCF8395286.1 hypothetical protein [Melioribacteraceae bacterium]MCF8420727.1 hypothetical protein [Melioribacteraceae bacterium]
MRDYFNAYEIKSTSAIFSAGFFFGIIQSALYFTVQVNITATYTGYFLIVFMWIAGVVFSLQTNFINDIPKAFLLAIISYYLLVFITGVILPGFFIYLLCSLLVFASAVSVGVFFKILGQKVEPDKLFFHENNGFVAGTITGLLYFVDFGMWFVYLIPAAALVLVLLSISKKEILIVLLLLLTAVFHGIFGNVMVFIVTSLLLALYLIMIFKPADKNQPPNNSSPCNSIEIGLGESRIILFIAGFNLIVLQYFIVREFSSILSANELTIFIISVSYFAGFSIGYILSKKISTRVLQIISVIYFVLHIFTFIFIKYFAAYLILAGLNVEALLLLLFVSSLLTSSYYSVFLPKIISAFGIKSFADSYTFEIAGSASGIIFIMIAIFYSANILFPFYFLFFAAAVYLLISKTRFALSFIVIAFFFIGFYTLNQENFLKASAIDFYQSRGYENPDVLYSGYSFYHSVEVIQTHHDAGRKIPKSRASFINGVRYFDNDFNRAGKFANESSLSEFTYFLAELPAKYLYEKRGKKLKILVLGGGSLYSISRTSPYSEFTTVVEIDPLVVESSKKYWSYFNRYNELSNYEIVIDDAKKYLKTTGELFDLIIMDISAPYYLGTALLHNKEFFELVKTRLLPGGIFSESTQGRPKPARPGGTGMKILKAVRDVFPFYRVIDCRSEPRGRRGFVMASENFDFSTAEIVNIMKSDNMYKGTSTYWENSSHFDFSRVTAYSVYDLNGLLVGNYKRFNNRINLDDRFDDENFFDKIESHSKEINFILPVYFLQQVSNKNFLISFTAIIIVSLVLGYKKTN